MQEGKVKSWFPGLEMTPYNIIIIWNCCQEAPEYYGKCKIRCCCAGPGTGTNRQDIFVPRLLRCFDLIITPKSLKFMRLRQSLEHHLKRKVMKSVDIKVCGLSTRSLFYGGRSRDCCLSHQSFFSAVGNTNTITPTVIYWDNSCIFRRHDTGSI